MKQNFDAKAYQSDNFFISKETKMNSFMKIGKNLFSLDFFKKQKLKKQIDKFIDIKAYDTILKFLENGYFLNTKQINKINTFLLEEVEEIEEINNNQYETPFKENLTKYISFIDKFEKFLLYDFKCSKKLNQKLIIQVSLNPINNFNIGTDFLNQNKIINYNDKKYPLLTQYLKKCISDENLVLSTFKNVFKDFQSSFRKMESAREDYFSKSYLVYITNQNKYYREIIMSVFSKEKNSYNFLKVIGFEKACEIDIYFQKYIKKSLTNNINECFSKEINQSLQEIKKQYTQEYIENQTISSIDKTKYKLKELPSEAQQILDKIENTYNKMSEEFKTLDFECKNLFEKKIPEILRKYLLLDEEYRDKYLHMTSGLTPKETLLESLNNISDHISDKWLSINKQTASDLNALNRYTKNFKP